MEKPRGVYRVICSQVADVHIMRGAAHESVSLVVAGQDPHQAAVRWNGTRLEAQIFLLAVQTTHMTLWGVPAPRQHMAPLRMNHLY